MILNQSSVSFKFLIPFLSILININANAQLDLFVTGGVNYANMRTPLYPDATKEVEQSFLHYRWLGNLSVAGKYKFNNWNVTTGIGISCRGAKDYSFPFPNFPYLYNSQTFLEVPVIASQFILKNKLELGFGLVNAWRIAENAHYYGDKEYQLDAKLMTRYFLLRRLAVEFSYLYGGIDRIISNKEYALLHSVFAFNVNYSFFKGKEKLIK